MASNFKDKVLDGENKADRIRLEQAVELIEEVVARIRKSQMINESKVNAFDDGVFAGRLQSAADLLKEEISTTKIKIRSGL